MFYIRNGRDAKLSLTGAEHLAFVKSCETYIGALQSENRLIAAQPVHREGVVLRRSGTGWEVKQLDLESETQVGYYHIRATDIDDAIAIAKQNPEFQYVPGATIEIKLVKTKESGTGFVYPSGA